MVTTELKGKTNGWVLKSGEFVGCGYGEHLSVILNKWHKSIKISSYDGGSIFCLFYPTQAQINTIYEWCEANDRMDMWKEFKYNCLN